MPKTPLSKPPSSSLAALQALIFRPKLSRRRMVAAIVAAPALALVLTLLLRTGAKEDYSGSAYAVKKSDLVISVLEGGSLTATDSQEIKCAVEGQTAILHVVPDGYLITDQDVKEGKVLLELDSSKLREQAIQEDIAFQDASAAFTQAQEQLEIQKNQNESDVSAAELQIRFARMDLEKFLGTELTTAVVDKKVDIGQLITGRMNPHDAAAALRKLNLGGSAWQTWERLQSDIDLAAAAFSNQITCYQWDRRLGPKVTPEDKLIADADRIVAQKLGRNWPDKSVTESGYVQGTDVQTDALTLKTKLSALEQADLTLGMFLQYDFAKQASSLLSAYTEAARNLERTKAKAHAALVMAEKNLRTREEPLKIEREHNERIAKQVAACSIRAVKPGMVVYSSTSDPLRAGQDKIQEGAIVREGEVILTIPNPSGMEVTVRVHEASVGKIKPGQSAKIIVEAFPDLTLSGAVTRVARLPEIPNGMSPDLKVYPATVTVKDAPPTLKPGMSAQVEILVDKVADALAVPIQAVFDYSGRRVCCVLQGNSPQPRLVETGQFNDNFIQILEGVNAGEKVLLRPPTISDAVLTELVRKASEKPKVESHKPAENGNTEASATSGKNEDTAPPSVAKSADGSALEAHGR